MPRIRKETSNRGTTHQRSKIGKKAAETRKKNRRSVKKDVTWKSKKTKDPGIPNSFPYKAEVLAEIAAQRQLNEEEKIRMKEERRAASKGAVPEPAAEEDEDEVDPLGVNTLVGSRVKSKAAMLTPANDDDDNSDAEMDDEVEEIDDDVSGAPLLFDAELPTLQAALEKADVLLEVVDARDPLGFRSPWLEELFVGEDDEGKKGKVVIVLTKIDLVPREALQQWLLFLRPRFITILFKSKLPSTHNLGPTPKTIKNAPKFPLPLSAAKKAEEEDRRMRLSHSEACGREELLEVLERWAGEKKASGDEDEFVVVVAGLPNVGKSSVLNTLLGESHFPIAHYPPTSQQSKVTTTTPGRTTYTSTSSSTSIMFVDTPGWIFADVFPGDDAEEEDEEEENSDREETEEEAEMWDVIETNRVRDLLRRNLGRVDRIKEPLPLAEYIIAHASTNDLMLLYSTPAFLATSPHSFLTSLARVQGRLKKHGVPDLDAAARIVLRDWSLSQFPFYTLPAKGATLAPRVPAEVETLSLFAGDKEEKVLARVRTRREMIGEKGGRGVVKMKTDEIFNGVGDSREVVLDDELRQEEDDSDGSEDGDDWEDDEDEDDEEMEVDGEEVFADDDGEEPIDSEVDDDEEEVPSMLELINAATSSKSKKRSAPPAAPATTSRPSKKAAVAAPTKSSKPVAAAPSPAASKKHLTFAAQPKGKTPKGYGVVDEENPPVSILKAAPSPSAPVSKKNGKKAQQAAPVPAPTPVVATPAIGADAVELKKSGASGRKEKKKVETKEKKEKSGKHGKVPVPVIVAATPAPVPAKKIDSKAADRAKSSKGEQAYDFNSHFF